MITSPNEYECQSAQHTCCVDWWRDFFVFDMQLGYPTLKIMSLYSQMKLTEKGMQNSTILSGIIFFKFVDTKSNI